MDRVAIVTDSACCLPQELIERYRIQTVPILIVYQGRSYRDKIDITPAEIYRIMRQRKDLPTTSVPSPEDFLSVYRRLSNDTRQILCITVTGLQSGIFNMAASAAEMARETLPDINIEVLDSRAVAGSLGFIVLEAARAAEGGASLEVVKQVARRMMDRVASYYMLDTLYYLARTGRVARAAAWAGSILNMKPVVAHFPSIGETTPVARPRTRERGIATLLQIMTERAGNKPVHVIVEQADEIDEALKLKNTLASHFNCAELYLTEFSSTMGVHAGPGVIGISFYTD